MQVLMGVLNVGTIINFIGFHVINGFTTAAAVTIFTSQVCAAHPHVKRCAFRQDPPAQTVREGRACVVVA